MWIAAGVIMMQFAQTLPEKSVTNFSIGPLAYQWIGFRAAFSACVLSGFAGTYFEKILQVEINRILILCK